MLPEGAQTSSDLPDSFAALAASRREWIDTVLHPWCQRASLKQLRLVEAEWLDIAGRVDVQATLWTWAWERFPLLTHPEMSGVNETYEVCVTLNDGVVVNGFPDSRRSERGVLVLIVRDDSTGEHCESGPYAIDSIVSVVRAV